MTSDRAFITLCAAGFVCFLSYNQVRVPALALFAESLGAGAAAIGVIVAASTFAGVLLKLPAGVLSDIWGRGRLLQAGALAFALPPFAYPFVSDVEVLTALRFLHGLATALFAPAALAVVADLFAARRGEAMGWYAASTQAGGWAGPLLGGWLIHAAGFPATFLTAGAIGLAGAALVFAADLGQTDKRQGTGEGRSGIAAALSGLTLAAGHRTVPITSLADAAKTMARGALMAFLPLYALSAGLHAGEVGLLFGAQGLTSLLAKPLMGKISDTIGRRPMIVLGLVLASAALGGIPHVSDLIGLAALAALFGLGEAVVTSCAAAFVADAAAPAGRGAALGLLGTVGDGGQVCGPILTGLLIAHFGYPAAFTGLAAIQVAAALLFLMLARDSRPERSPQGPPAVL